MKKIDKWDIIAVLLYIFGVICYEIEGKINYITLFWITFGCVIIYNIFKPLFKAIYDDLL
jgi:hypothetical protein